MSRIYFHSEHDEDDAELRGSERAYMGHVCNSLMLQALNLYDDFMRDTEQHWLTSLLPATHYARQGFGRRQIESLRTAFAAGFDLNLTLPDGQQTNPFTLSLNTALRLGGDPLKLMARLHGQCELHTWVDGPHRAWLADIIEHGRAINLYRADEGWEQVAALLRQRDDCPVITSYSVCDGFPNREMGEHGGWDGDADDEDGEEWYSLDAAEHWRYALAGLKAVDADYRYTRELRPDTWSDYRMSNGISAYDLKVLARQE